MNSACQAIVDNKDAIRAGGLILVLAWETWLGKTDRITAGSTLELVYNLLVKPKAAPQNQPQQEEKKDATQ